MQAARGKGVPLREVGDPADYQVVSTVSLSQDVVISSNVIVDVGDINPLACFPNPGKQDGDGNALVEALALISTDEGKELVWVQRAAVETGWQTVPFGDLPATPVEIAAGLAIDGSPAAFYSDGQKLYWMSLDVGSQTWSTPASLYGGAVSNLGVAYNNSNVLIAYGRTSDDNLVIAQPSGRTFTAAEYDIAGALSGANDFVVCNNTSNGWWLGIADGASGRTFGGELGQAGYQSSGTMPVLPGGAHVASVKFGYFMQGNLVFVVTGSDGNIYSVYGHTATKTTFSGSTTVRSVTGQVTVPESAECISLFATDTDGNLWVMNTPPASPFNPQTGPNWAPWIPLAGNTGAVVGDLAVSTCASLFTIDATYGTVGLWTRDPVTTQWSSNPILQSGPGARTAYEVTRYRAEFSIMNNGVPAAGVSATLALDSGSSTTTLSIGGQPYTLASSGNPVEVQADVNGRVTAAILVTRTLVAPALVLTVNGTAFPACQVNGGIKNYLSGGTTPLNPTNPSNAPQPLDGTGAALFAAKSASGQPLLNDKVRQETGLVRTAAQGIMQVAGLNPGQGARGAAGGPVGFAFSLRRDAPEFRTLHTRHDFTAWSEQNLAADGLGGIWDDIKSFAGDIYQGIASGLIAIENAAIDLESGVAKLTLTIANAVTQAVSLAVKAVDDVVNLVSGVFQAIEVAVEDVIDWLKALFDFAAIWNTKVWIEQAIVQGLADVQGFLNGIGTPAENWFSNQFGTLNGSFSALAAAPAGSTTVQSAPNYSAPGQPPATPLPGPSGATTGSVANNVHPNWLQDKVTSGGPPDLPLPATGIDAAYDAFQTALQNAGDALTNQFAALFTWFQGQITGNASFGELGISTVVTAFQALLKDLLAFADAVVASAITLLADATGLLATALTTPLDLGPINTLWNWIAEEAGQPGGDTLTIASLVSLLLAFPTTIAWKLVKGVNSTPFPSTPPWGRGGDTLAREDGAPSDGTTYAEVAQFVRIVAALPCLMYDTLGPNTPALYRYARSVGSITAFACTTGLPAEESFLKWAEANPGAAANAVGDALWPAVAVIGAYRSLSYPVARTIMGVANSLVLGWNVYRLVKDDTTDLIRIIVSVTWPLPNVFSMFFPKGFVDTGEVGALFAAVNGMIYFFDPVLLLSEESTP